MCAARTGNWYLANLNKTPRTGHWVLPVSRRITTSDGQFAGVIVASVLPSYFQAFYDSIDQEKHGFVTLFLSSGTAVVTSPRNESVINRNWAQSPLFRQALPSWPTGTARQAEHPEERRTPLQLSRAQ